MTQFTIRTLHVLAYAGGCTHWVYRAPDADIIDILTPGFFNAAADVFAQGDLVTITANRAVAQRWVHMPQSGGVQLEDLV
jgi:hypothetical protein